MRESEPEERTNESTCLFRCLVDEVGYLVDECLKTDLVVPDFLLQTQGTIQREEIIVLLLQLQDSTD